jgi:transposase
MPGPQAVPIVLSDAERQHLEKITRQLTAPQRLVQRSRIALCAAAGLSNAAIAREVRCARGTVVLWRGRFAKLRLAGLEDEPRPGRPRSFSPTAAP